MLKSWILVFIGIALFANSAICEDEFDFFEDVSMDLIQNLPKYLKEAVDLLEKEESANVLNGTEYSLFPRISQCTKDYLRIYTSLLRKKRREWAFKVIDSWGKFPSGVARGNLYELGDFDECLNNVVPNQFEPQYCVLRIGQYDLALPPKSGPAIDTLNTMRTVMASSAVSTGLKPRMVPTVENMIAVNFGICLPKSCSPERINKVLKIVQKRIMRNKISLATIPYSCQTVDDLGWNFSTWDYVTLGLILVIILVIALSTVYDIVKTKQNEEKPKVLIAFSLYTNGQQLFSCKRPMGNATMECLNGMRVLSAFWVVYAHSHLMALGGPVFNLAYVLDWFSEVSSLPLMMAWFSVDTFLFISGFLITGSLLRQLQRTRCINLPKVYIHRYLRLTAILAFVILFSVTVYRRIANGPMWWLYIEHGINCDKNWWSALLYIQNYYNPEAICLMHTWYLSVDMQLFLIAPILAYLFYRLGNPFMLAIGLLMAATITGTYLEFVNRSLTFKLSNISNDIQDVFIKTYYPSHIRMTPWLFGGAYAYFMNKMQGRIPNWSTVRIGVHWLVSGALVLGLTWYTYEMQQKEHTASSMESGLYTGFSRFIWSIIVCLVIHACISGYGGPVNSFLSLPMWRPLGRLTYAIYIVHMPIMIISSASAKRPIYFSFRVMLLKYFGDMVVAILASILLTLGIESPVAVLEGILFSLGKKKTRNELPTVTRIRPLDESTQQPRPKSPAP